MSYFRLILEEGNVQFGLTSFDTEDYVNSTIRITPQLEEYGDEKERGNLYYKVEYKGVEKSYILYRPIFRYLLIGEIRVKAVKFTDTIHSEIPELELMYVGEGGVINVLLVPYFFVQIVSEDIAPKAKELESQFNKLESGKIYTIKCSTPARNYIYTIPEAFSRIGGLHFKLVDLLKDANYEECGCIKLEVDIEQTDFLVVPLWFLQISPFNSKQDDTVMSMALANEVHKSNSIVEPMEHQNTYTFRKGLRYSISRVAKLTNAQLDHFVYSSEFNMLCTKDLTVKKDLVDSGVLNRQPKMPNTENKPNILLEDCKNTFTECLAILERKNNDYAGKDAKDVFKNFRACSIIGVDPKYAVLVRITDKLTRIGNLLKQEAAVKDEAIEDTINDAINYFAILKSLIKNKVE